MKNVGISATIPHAEIYKKKSIIDRMMTYQHACKMQQMHSAADHEVTPEMCLMMVCISKPLLLDLTFTFYSIPFHSMVLLDFEYIYVCVYTYIYICMVQEI